MANSKKVIVTCAVTGAIHTPSMSPYLPVTAKEIGDSAIAAAKAGASIIHLHARNEEDGRPDQTPEAFMKFLPQIKEETDAVINITTGGSPLMSIQERLQPALKLAPEVASLSMGSMNFGLFPMLDRFKDLRHPWEKEYLEKSRDLVFKNTFQDIEYILKSCSENGTRFECECYDVGHLYNLAYFVDKKIIEAPLLIQTVFGVMGGLGTHPEDLMHMRRTADRLFGSSYQWSILGAGRQQIPLATMGAAMGSHVRVGLEDSLWINSGTLAQSNAEQVTKIRTVIEALSLSVATPDEAREILNLKGRNNVNF